MEEEEKDKIIIDVLSKQNELLDTMQKTIHKLTKAITPAESINFSFAEILKRGMNQKHGDVAGLQEDYRFVMEEVNEAP
jgi:hypothetical protein